MKFFFNRTTPMALSVLLLAGALLLAACSGNAAAQVQAVVEAQTQTEPVASAEEVIEEAVIVEADDGAEVEVSTEGDQSGDAEYSAEVSEERSAEASVEDARAIPVLVPGSPALKSTDPATFEIASGRIQLLEFFAFWCPTCKRMASTVHGLEDIYGEQINFVFLDQDDPATASFRETFGYRYQPEFYLLNPDGIILGTWIGYTDGAILQEAIEHALQ